MGDEKRGIYQKFIVTRTDGLSAPNKKHYNCQYWVLDLDHDKHSLAALRAYRDSLVEHREHPLLVADLSEEISKLHER